VPARRWHEAAVIAARVGLNADPSVVSRLGLATQVTGRHTELFHIDRLLATSPQDVPFLMMRGTVMAERGRFAEAARSYGACRRIDPADSDHWLCEGAALLAAGDLGGHRELCRQLLTRCRKRRDRDDIKALARLLAAGPPPAAGDLRQALSLLASVEDEDEDDREVLTLHGALLIRAGRPADALLWLGRDRRAWAATVPALIGLAAGGPARGLRVVAAAPAAPAAPVEADPATGLWTALALHGAGQHDRARAALRAHRAAEAPEPGWEARYLRQRLTRELERLLPEPPRPKD
jgi:tetratricopeptide (TPR) repeat protein